MFKPTKCNPRINQKAPPKDHTNVLAIGNPPFSGGTDASRRNDANAASSHPPINPDMVISLNPHALAQLLRE